MTVKFNHKLISIFLCCLILQSCRGSGFSYVELMLPEFPGMVSGQWIVEYPFEVLDGIPVYTEERISDETILCIARGENLPVFLRPVFNLSTGCGTPEALHVDEITGGFPAGAVYPCDVSGGKLIPCWEDGFACEILYRCLINSDVIRCFDTAAFREAVSEKAVETASAEEPEVPGGAWLLDPVPVISRLGYGLFRESSLKAAEIMSFNIPAAAGIWFSDNPLYPPVVVEDEGAGSGRLNVTVPINRKTVFTEPVSAGIIEVFFNESLWCWSNLLSGASESGRR